MFHDFIQFKKEVFLGEQGQLISEQTFEIYKATNGFEMATAYLQALHDFNAQLEVILGGGFCRNGVPTSGHVVRNKIMELRDHNLDFLRNFDIENSSKNNISNEPI